MNALYVASSHSCPCFCGNKDYHHGGSRSSLSGQLQPPCPALHVIIQCAAVHLIPFLFLCPALHVIIQCPALPPCPVLHVVQCPPWPAASLPCAALYSMPSLPCAASITLRRALSFLCTTRSLSCASLVLLFLCMTCSLAAVPQEGSCEPPRTIPRGIPI